MAIECPGGVKKALPYWPVLLVAFGAAVAWGGQQKTVSDNADRITKLEDAITKQGETAAVLDERTKSTREDVKEIKGDIKRVLTEVLKRGPGTR